MGFTVRHSGGHQFVHYPVPRQAPATAQGPQLDAAGSTELRQAPTAARDSQLDAVGSTELRQAPATIQSSQLDTVGSAELKQVPTTAQDSLLPGHLALLSRDPGCKPVPAICLVCVLPEFPLTNSLKLV